MFAVNVKRGAAGNQEFQIRAHGEEISQSWRGLKKMFEIIEQEEHRRARWILKMFLQQFER